MAGSDLTVINSGTITGGQGGPAVPGSTAGPQGPAIWFLGGTNRLELQAGSTINGNVLAVSGGTDVLALGGTAASTFDASLIGAAAQYRNFASFEKTGTSTWTLSGTNTTATPWSVQAGTLLVNGALNNAASTVAVASGATLGGTGTIGGSVTLADGAALAPGTTTAPGTLTINGALALGATSVLNYRLGAPDVVGGALNDLTVVGGNLTLDGTLNITQSPGGTFGVGLYRVITYSGTLTDNGLLLGTQPAGSLNTVQTSVAGQVNLVSATPGFWDGGGGAPDNGVIDGGTGTWQGPAGNSNWTTANGAVNAPYVDGTFSVFAATPGTVTVDDSLGAVNPGGMQFAVSGYVVEGDPITLTAGGNELRVGDGTALGATYSATIASELSGAGGINKTDLGTLVLSATNFYTGGTTVSAGTLQLGDGGTSGAVVGDITNNATLAFNHSGPVTVGDVISGTGNVIKDAANTLTLTGANTYTGTTTIRAGTLQIGDGGTAGALAGAVINNAALAFNRSDTLTYAGAISGAGTLSQIGAGTTALTGNSATFSGTTHVTNGTLLVLNGPLGSAASTMNVSNNATLGGTGTVGGSVAIADGLLAPGIATEGVLTINGNLSLSAASQLNFDFGQSLAIGGLANDQAVVGGNLVLDGTLNMSVPIGRSFGAGLYRVISYGGTLTDNGLVLGTQPVGSQNSVQTAIAGEVNVVNTAGVTVGFWDGTAPRNDGLIGGGSGTWQAAGVGSNDNWTDATAAGNAPYPSGILAIFAAQPGTVTVDDSLGAVVSGGMQFASSGYVVRGDAITLAAGTNEVLVGDGSAASTGYVATIAADLTGAGGVDKTDLGTLVLTGANSYSGGTTISAGTLQLGEGVNGGTSGAIAGNVTNNAALAFNRSDAVTFSGTISGAGVVTHLGANTLTFTADNTYTGDTTISGGTLQLGDGGTTGAIAGNAINNGALVFNRANALALAGVISGTGGVSQIGAGTTSLTGANTYTGGTTISAGTLQLGEGVNGGTSGAIVGDVATTAGGTLAFNRADALDFAGAISGAGTLSQIGAGATTLSGHSAAFSGATHVTNGALLVSATATLGSAASTVSVSNNATLGGAGTLGGSVTIADGILAPGTAPLGAPSTLTIQGDLSLSAASQLNYDFGQAGVIGGALNDLTLVGGNLTLDGALNVNVPPAGAFGPGLYRVISYSGTLTNNNLAIGTQPAGSATSVQTSVAGQVNLVNTTGVAVNFWDGGNATRNNGAIDGGNGVWQAAGVGANDNWTDATGALNAAYAADSFVIFAGAPGTVTLDNSLGAVVSAGMQFASSGYVIEGAPITLAAGRNELRVGDGTTAGALYTATIAAPLADGSAASSVDKTDLGTLVLTGANTYTGGTTISAGTLQLGEGVNGGTSGAITGNVTNAGVLAFNRADVITFAGTISDGAAPGAVQQRGTGTTILTGANSYSGGTTIGAGTLQIGDGGTSGAIAGNVTNAGVLAFNRSDAVTFAGTISDGAAPGAVQQLGTGTTILTADNTYSGGTTIGAGTLQIGNGGTSGAIAGNVTNNAALVVDRSDALTFAGTISGTGALTKRGANALTLTADNTFSGLTTIEGGALQLGNGGASGGLAGDVLNNGALVLNRANTLSLNGTISGTGSVAQIGAGTTVLGGANTYGGGTTLAAGTLQIASDANLGDAGGALTLSGGALRTTADMTTARATTLNAAGGTVQTQAGTTLTHTGVIAGAGLLTKTGAGTLVLSGTNTYRGGTAISDGTLAIASDANLGEANAILAFNGGTLQTSGDLATARTTTLNAPGGTLQTQAGTTLTHAGPIAGAGMLTKSGAGTLVLTADNTYSGGTTIAGGTLAIARDANLGAVGPATGALVLDGGTLQSTASLQTARATTLAAGGGTLQTQAGTTLTHAGAITGAGMLTKSGAGALVLAADNTYAGGTTISQGTLQLGNAGTTGAIVGDVLNNATLAFERSDAVSFAGTISGSGTLIKRGANTLTLSGANTYAGGTALKSGQLTVGHNSALGSGELAMDEGTTLGFALDGLVLANAVALTGTSDPVIDTGAFTETLSGAITGGGALTKLGSGTLVLAGAPGANTYSGATTVAAGTLRAGAPETLSAASAHTVAPGATLETAGFHQRVAALTNSGTVSLVSPAGTTAGTTAGSTLTVAGPYVGNGGVLNVGTALAGGASVSDRLVLDGPTAAASGATAIQIASPAGLGALTTGNGIEVVGALNGATTTAQTSKSAFSLAGGHVDAGAYEYQLYAADADGGGENWYLRSAVRTQPTPPDGPDGPDGPGSQPTPPGLPGLPPGWTPTYRTEVPLLASLPAQLRQADLAMLGNLHRRLGDEAPGAAASAPASDQAASGSASASASGSASGAPTLDTAAAFADTPPRRAWGRLVYADLDIQQPGAAQVRTDGHVSGLQAGTDLWGQGPWRAGVYVGYLDGRADVSGNARGITARVGSNTVRSRFLGAYATWMDSASGWYVDTVVQGASQRYEIRPDINPTVSGKASSFTASIEAGKSFALSDRWRIEPQAQLAWLHSSYDELALSGARVQQDAQGGWIARLGVRVKGDLATPAGRLAPYARVNLYRANFGEDSATFIGPAATTTIATQASYSAAELAAGATLALTPATSLYSEIGHLWDIGGQASVKSSVQASLGIRMRW